MANYQVVWRGLANGSSGRGIASREYFRALVRQGVNVKLAGKKLGSLRGKKRRILINHNTPRNINLKKERKKFHHIILNTVWETTRIPRNWFPAINKYDAVCVPSTHNKRALRNSGVRVPVYIVPHGVNSTVYSPANRKLPVNNAKGKFIFVSIFSFQHRKNPEALLKAYWREFSSRDNVLLVIKTSGFGSTSHQQIQRTLLRFRNRCCPKRNPAPILLLPSKMRASQIKRIYTLGHVFVLPTRGEGVGLPFLEALVSGIPVIATGWGGHMDFLNRRNSFLIPYKLMNPASRMSKKYSISRTFRYLFAQRGQLWAEPSITSLQKLMRFAYQHPALCKQKGLQGRRDVRKLTWNRSGHAMKRVIHRVMNRSR